MIKTTRSFVIPSAAGRLVVPPDHAQIAISARVEGATASSATAAARAIQGRVEEAAGPGAEVQPRSLRSWTEKLAGKGLFGHGVRAVVEVTLAVRLRLDPSWDFWERAARVAELNGRLQALDALDELTLGEPCYLLEERDAPRLAAARAMHACLTAVAAAMGMALQELELAPALEVEILAPDRAAVSLTGRYTLGA